MAYQTQPVTMWFDRRIGMRKSPIEGIGTFALDIISAGETLVLVSGGIVYTTQDWRDGKVPIEGELYNEGRIAPDLLIATPKSFHYYINHSCDPNAVDISRSATTTHYVALRDIQPGEEITTDYGLYGEANIAVCRCGSEICKGSL